MPSLRLRLHRLAAAATRPLSMLARAKEGWQPSFRAHVIALAIASMLPLAGLGVYSTLRLAAGERAADQSEIVGTARAVATTIEQTFRHHLRILRALATRLPREDADLADFYGNCAAHAAENDGWIFLADSSGRQILNTRRPLGAALPTVAPTRDFAEAVATGEPRISNLHAGMIEPQPQVAVYQPIIEDGRVTRVLGIVFATRALNALLRAQHLPEAWMVAAIDRDGTIVANPDDMAPVLGHQASPEIRALAAQRSEGFLHLTNRRGVAVHVAAAPSALSGWTVVVGIPAAIINAPLHQTLRRFAVAGGALLLLALGAAALIGGHLAKAMRQLAGAAGALARHEPIPATRSTVREVNQAARALRDAGNALAESAAQLRRSQQHLLKAQHVARMGSVEHDLKSGKIECSDEVFHIFGVDRAGFDLNRRNMLALIHPEDRDRLREAMAAVRPGIDRQSLECRIVRPDGEIRIVRREAEPILDESGAPCRLFVTLLDVTEQRAAEERQRQLERELLSAQQREADRLRDSEARLRRSQQHLAVAQRVAQTGSVLYDVATETEEWSDELYRTNGLKRGEQPATFAAVLPLVLEEDRAKLVAVKAAVERGEQPAPMQYRLRRPDGELRTILLDVAPLGDDDCPPSQVVVTLRDVTELRAAEERERDLERQLLHAQKLEALGTLAGGVAHDLNNALVPVLALAKMTMRRLPEGSREHANLATILKAGERARDLVRQILAFSRKDAPTRQAVDLAALLRDSLRMLASSLPATIRIDEAIEEVPLVSADPGQLHQVAINLMVNAAHAIGDKMGMIAVRLDAEPPPLPDAGGNDTLAPIVHLAVVDTGCGMDETTRQRIFEPFFTTKPVGEGTGLGLSVVHGIIAQHGGRIAVESRPGEGTRFDIYLPALSGEEEAEQLETAALAI